MRPVCLTPEGLTVLQVEVFEQPDAYSLLVALPGVESSAGAVSLLLLMLPILSHIRVCLLSSGCDLCKCA